MRKPTKKFPGVYQNTDTRKYGARTRIGVDQVTGKERWQRREDFDTAHEAFEWKNKVSASGRSRTRVAPTRITVAELLASDIDTQRKLGRIRTSTADTYHRHAEHAKPIGHLRASELTARHIDHLYADLLAAGRSAATVRLLHAVGSGAYTRVVRRGDVTENPWKLVTPPGENTDETPTWSLAELQRFLGSDVVRDDPDFALWWTLSSTGLRRGEALGLHWCDIDLNAGVIDVRHNLAMIGDNKFAVGPPKTKRSRRRVKIDADTARVLRDHRGAQREHRVAMGSGYTDRDLVFAAPDGEPRNPSCVSSRFRQLVKKTGLPPVTLHALRHCHATMLVDGGERIHDVAARLGHDPAVLLRRYAHHGADSQDSATALVQSSLRPRPALRVVGGEDD